MPSPSTKQKGITTADIAANWEYFVVQYDVGGGHKREVEVLAPNKKIAMLSVGNFNDETLSFKPISASDKTIGKLTTRKAPSKDSICAFMDFLQRGLTKNFTSQDALWTSLVTVTQPVLRGMIGQMRHMVSSGEGYLADALAEFPDAFFESHVKMLRAAQTSSGTGGIGEMMSAIVRTLKNADKLRKQFRKKMTYPVLVFALGFFASCGLLFFALPGAVEPALEDKREVWAISLYPYLIVKFIRDTPLIWPIPFVVIFALIVQWKVIKNNEWCQRKLCAVPKLGPAMLSLGIVNPLRTLSMSQKANLPPSARMTIACDSSPNPVVKDFFAAVATHVRSGVELSTAIARECWRVGNVGDRLAAQAVISKRTGEGTDLLDGLADTIEEDAESRIQNLAMILEPLTILAVLVMVFGAFAAVYSVQIQVLFEYLGAK